MYLFISLLSYDAPKTYYKQCCSVDKYEVMTPGSWTNSFLSLLQSEPSVQIPVAMSYGEVRWGGSDSGSTKQHFWTKEKQCIWYPHILILCLPFNTGSNKHSTEFELDHSTITETQQPQPRFSDNHVLTLPGRGYRFRGLEGEGLNQPPLRNQWRSCVRPQVAI